MAAVSRRSGRTVLFICCTFILTLFTHNLFAATWTVRQDGSGQFTTINAARAVATTNDIIEVGPGTYPEEIDFDYAVTLVSTSGATATILDGQLIRRVLIFRAGTGSVVDGFTIRNGVQVSSGGGLRVQFGATCTMRNCILEGNHADFDGGAIITRDPGTRLDVFDCTIRNNTADRHAAGVLLLSSSVATYTRCRFEGNVGDASGAVAMDDHSLFVARDCLFLRNSGAYAGVFSTISTVDVQNCTFVNNTSLIYTIYTNGNSSTPKGPATTFQRNIVAGDTGASAAYYAAVVVETRGCNVYWQNNSSIASGSLQPDEKEADPLFCDALHDLFTLDSHSPAAAPNSACGQLIGAFGVGCGPVAVAISSFDAKTGDGVVTLHGTFTSDLGVQAVNVYRGEGDASFIRLATITEIDGSRFDYTDKSVAPGKAYRYQIGVTDGDGEFMSAIQSVAMPALKTGVQQNYPNPFNPQTAIRFTLSSNERVELVVYDATGGVVRTLVNETRAAGNHDVTWDGRNNGGATVASGVYFYRFHAGKISETKRMVLLK